MADHLKTVELLRTQTVSVGNGESFEVRVPAKGATGNVWTMQDSTDVRMLSHTKNPSRVSFGGGGVEVFTLQPIHEGPAKVQFTLGAPWRSEPAEVHHLSIDVLPKKEAAG